MQENSGDEGMFFAAPAATNISHDSRLKDVFDSLASIDVSPITQIALDLVEDTLVNQCIEQHDSQNIPDCQNHSGADRMNPFLIANERTMTWPHIDPALGHITTIYNKVKATGLPNSLGAKIILDSSIRFDNWRALSSAHPIDEWLLQMLRYGFPLQYTGKAPRANSVKNHSSATAYPEQVRKFISKELAEGALAGPFSSHPFPSSCYVNPLMSRPKAGSDDRRIIVDLAYPEGEGVNAHVRKNCVFGTLYQHELPTTENAIHMARTYDLNVLVAVIDIERAYRNYRSDPIDWPLLVISCDDQYYIDLGLPFGARLSSLYVQRIANFIVSILTSRGIQCAMYLDDLFLACHKHADVQTQFSQAMALIRSLGLPINFKKLITPTTQAVWLGVSLDFDKCVISIPQKKVEEFLDVISQIYHCQFISYKQTQSIIGRIAHFARVIPAARIFMSRILDQLRASDGHRVYINHSILADLKWFKTYFVAHNATSIIDISPPAAVIEADSSLAAGGAWCDGRYYIYSYPPRVIQTHNICQLEALNYLIAIRAFVGPRLTGRTVEVIGDNAGAISALATGRAVDTVLAAVSRALWFHCASEDIKVVFTHRAGTLIAGADALSRAPLGETERGRANSFISDKGLRPVKVYPAFINYAKYL